MTVDNGASGQDGPADATDSGSAPPPDDDTDAIAAAVLTASRLLVGLSAKSVATVAGSISLPQFRLLVVLATRGPCKLVTLADALGVNPSTATRTVSRLVTAGWARRGTNPHSRREITVELTSSGSSLVEQVNELRRQEIAAIVGRMPADRRQGLVEALRAFTDAGEEPRMRIPSSDVTDTDWPGR